MRDCALIRLQMRIFLESASTKLCMNTYFTRRCGKYIKQKDERSRKLKHCTDREFVEGLISSVQTHFDDVDDVDL